MDRGGAIRLFAGLDNASMLATSAAKVNESIGNVVARHQKGKENPKRSTTRAIMAQVPFFWHATALNHRF
jgi:hypothetical protein